jgi:hypothetical protein
VKHKVTNKNQSKQKLLTRGGEGGKRCCSRRGQQVEGILCCKVGKGLSKGQVERRSAAPPGATHYSSSCRKSCKGRGASWKAL